MTKLPTPEQWALMRMNEIELAEEIEKFIDFVGDGGRSVHLPMQFVRHFHQRDDGLPTIVAIATLPIVLADGGLLAKEFGDFDEKRGIHFVIPQDVLKILPRREQCDDEAVRRAMQFLCDEWLVDIATDYAGKATIIAAALTLIERSLLPDRPAFFVTAGRRGSGKTTAIIMLIMGVTGIWPAASAWSNNEEERRKALLSYFLFGVPYILWDNIKRGSRISCPHIEKSCTSAYYADRKLGVSEMVATAASTIHMFTGNNIAPIGDLASRSLEVRLDVDRADPENRDFRHPDPVGWTENNRSEILQSLFVILLGNPALDLPRDAQMKTRFKLWERLVGSAVEHAAGLAGQKIDFSELFHAADEEDEEEISLAAVLNTMSKLWPDVTPLFMAQDLCDAINDKKIFDQQQNCLRSMYTLKDEDREELRSLFCPTFAANRPAASKSVGQYLNQHIDDPVCRGGKTLILRSIENPNGNGKFYKVEAKIL
jgi:hypothetical protein